MIGTATCDYGTVSPEVTVSWTDGAPDGSTMGVSWPPRTRRRVLVSQTTGTIEIPGDLPRGAEVTVAYGYREDTRGSGADLDLPVFERPKRPVSPRTRVHPVASAALAPKTVDRGTQVAWTRGRASRDLSFRTLRRLGAMLRR